MEFRERIEKDEARKALAEQRETEANRAKDERLAWSYEGTARKAVRSWAKRVGAEITNLQVELFITYQYPSRQLLRLSWQVDGYEFQGNFYEEKEVLSPKRSTLLHVELWDADHGGGWYQAETKHEIARVFNGKAAIDSANSDYTNKM